MSVTPLDSEAVDAKRIQSAPKLRVAGTSPTGRSLPCWARRSRCGIIGKKEAACS
jgi:hypothetical protein